MSTKPQGFDQLVKKLEELQATGASGVLMLQNGEFSLVLHIQDGSLVRAEETGRGSNILLAELAVRKGLVSEAEVNELLATHMGMDAGRLLVEAGVADRSTVAKLRALQVDEILSGLAVDPTHEVRFEARRRPSPQPGLGAIPLGDIVRDLQRRVDEWPLLIYRLGAREVEIEPLPVKQRILKRLSPVQSEIRALVDRRKTIGEVLDLSLYGEFLTLRTLCELLDRDMVRLIRFPGPQTREPTPQTEVEKLLEMGKGQQFATMLLSALVFLFVIGALFRWAGTYEAKVRASTDTVSLDRALIKGTANRLAAAIQIHRMLDGELPRSLDDLVAGRCITEDETRPPGYDMPFRYELSDIGRGYVLYPPYH